MNEAPKPIKRSPELAPLSREHHEGLLFVWKIRQGIKKEIHPERIVAFVLWFWQQELEPHFQKEETVLLPYINANTEFKERLLADHAAIKDHIQVVEHNRYWETLENLAHAVNDHIRWEERTLFNELEQRLDPEELALIGTQLTDKKDCSVWEDAFWEK